MNQKPFVLCHMLTSLNGKIDGSFFGNPATAAGVAHFARIRTEYRCDATLFGTTTMLGFSKGKLDPARLKSYTPVEVGDWLGPYGKESESYLVALDPMGSLAYESHCITRGKGPAQHVIEVVTEAVSGAYLAYLQELGISYLVAGTTTLDGAVILEKLQHLFGIERIALCGGGITNWTFFAAGTIDEVSLVVVPVVEGETQVGTSFDNPWKDSTSFGEAFSLKEVQVLSGNTLWIRYEAKNHDDTGI